MEFKIRSINDPIKCHQFPDTELLLKHDRTYFPFET